MSTEDPRVRPAPPDGAGFPRRSQFSPLRPLLLRLHFYAGILIGPFLLIAAFTGLLYAFTPQLEQVVYDRELHVPAGGAQLPLEAQVDAAQNAHPHGSLSALRPGKDPTDTTQVIFSSPELAESHKRTVFVNPYSAEVRGVLETYGSGQALPLRTWVDELHRGLHLGDIGRWYSELAASWLWVVVGIGLVLWWKRRRNRRRELVLPGRGVSGRKRTLSWHGVVGTWVAVALVFLSATGLSWSQLAGDNIAELRSAMRWETPSVSGQVHHQDHGSRNAGEHARHDDVGIDRVLASAREAGLTDPVEIQYPSSPGSTYVVQQTGRAWPSKQDSAAIDPYTGEITEVLRFADYPMMAKLTRWGIDAHMGLLFGIVNQLVLAAVAIALITTILLGYRMWWRRRPAGRGFGPPVRRGVWRSVPLPALGSIVLVASVVGWFLPLFGLSLLAFLAVDALIGFYAQRRRSKA
ncbi:PepSY-associated TM helix domain-containing protein [Parasphingorhabdus pacifica]